VSRSAPEPVGAIVVRESNVQRTVLYGFLTVAMGAAVVRGLLAHPRGLTVVAIAAVSAVLLLMLAAWWRTWRDPYRIEVSVERLRYLARDKREYEDIVRGPGVDLWLYARPVGRSDVLVLEQPATRQEWVLRFFARQPLIDACLARGWTVHSTRVRPS
jgi:hypothetical protein